MFAFLFKFARRRILIALLPTLISAVGAAVGWAVKRQKDKHERRERARQQVVETDAVHPTTRVAG